MTFNPGPGSVLHDYLQVNIGGRFEGIEGR